MTSSFIITYYYYLLLLRTEFNTFQRRNDFLANFEQVNVSRVLHWLLIV